MSSLVSLVTTDGPMHLGAKGQDVRALQLALSQAGYRVTIDPNDEFTGDTDYWVRRAQTQHNMLADGVVGLKTAALLDLPHDALVDTAHPLVVANGVTIHASELPAGIAAWPHDDTASLLSYFGRPWEDSSLVASVRCPWTLFYEGKPWPHPIQFHRLAAGALGAALNAIWDAAGRNNDSSILAHVRNFSGSGLYRAVRGSSRLSCHAFWAAIDFDADRLGMTHAEVSPSVMPEEIVRCFEAVRFDWGGSWRGRKDPMHFQAAHE